MDSAVALKKDEQSVFYKSYQNLCCLKQLPFQSIKQTDTHLEVLGDNIPMDEWGPILISLERDQSLYAVSVRVKPFTQILAMDFEDQVREYCTRPILQTRFVMMNLMTALQSCLSCNARLHWLTLDGLHLTDEYVAVLARGLAHAASLEAISLRRCGLRDVGLATLCVAIRNASNVLALDFTQCDVTDKGALVLSELLVHQRRLRACAGWTPRGGYGAESFLGVRRVTLNHNPGVGDKGASRLAATLAAPGESWLKGLDMQDCGLTDVSAIRFLELLDDATADLDVVDLRVNDVSPCLVREILASAGGSVDFPLMPQEKKITVRPPWIEVTEKDGDCFNNAAINVRQRPSSTSANAKPDVAQRPSRQTLASRPSTSLVSIPNPPPPGPSTAWNKSPPKQPSSTEDPEDTFRLNLKDIEDLSDSSCDSERTILKGLDEVSFKMSADELKKKGKEIADAIEATRKRRLTAEDAVRRAEDEMRVMLKTMEQERLLKEDAMRKREEMTDLIRDVDSEEMKSLARREMGRMVGDADFMSFRRMKSEGDLTSNAEEGTASDRSQWRTVSPRSGHKKPSDLLQDFEVNTRMNSLEFASGLEVARPRTASRIEAVLTKKRHAGDRGDPRPKPRATPSEILELMAKRRDNDGGGSGRSSASEWTFDAQLTVQSGTERIAALLKDTPSVLVEEVKGYTSGEDF